MTPSFREIDVDIRIQELRRDIFIDHPDARRVARQIESAVREFLAAKALGHACDARGVVILGPSGTGKTDSAEYALKALGLNPTRVGDSPRPQVFVHLKNDITLRNLRMHISLGYGWKPRTRDSAEDIWQSVTDYIERLETHVIVLDEIQHVRAAGTKDRQSMRDALKSLVQPLPGQVVPVLIGTPKFEELLNSDQQFKRRYAVVHMTPMTAGTDRGRVIKVLARYCEEADLRLGKSVSTKNFAERLRHAAHYAIGEVCVICLGAIKSTWINGNSVVEIEHFCAYYADRFDCVAEMNPFLAQDFLSIPTDADPAP